MALVASDANVIGRIILLAQQAFATDEEEPDEFAPKDVLTGLSTQCNFTTGEDGSNFFTL